MVQDLTKLGYKIVVLVQDLNKEGPGTRFDQSSFSTRSNQSRPYGTCGTIVDQIWILVG